MSRAVLQLGESAAPHLATPALPALLTEVRAVVAASDPRASEAAAAGGVVTVPGSTSGGGGKRGMGIEPAMSARKSSQKKQRRSREKEVGRALAAADAAATATAAGNGVAAGGSDGGSGGGGGVAWTGAAALAELEAVCSGLSCLSQAVMCCKGHLPLGGRLAVEDVLHRGLELLAHAGVGNSKGSGGDGGASGGSGGGGRAGGAGMGRGRCSRLEDPRVAREFFGLAEACLMTPLVRANAAPVGVCSFCPACGVH